VQQQMPEEVGDGQRAVGGFLRLAVAVAESDGADRCVVVDQIALADDAAVEVTRQYSSAGSPLPTARQSTTHLGGRPTGIDRPASLKARSSLARNTRANAKALNR
jgi:hypothetical protein